MKYTLIFVLINSALLCLSCGKTKPKKEEENIPLEKTPLEKVFIPIKLESDRLAINLKYMDNTAFLIEIKDSDGYSSTITYKNNHPEKLTKHRFNKPLSFVDYRITDDKITGAICFDVEGQVEIPAGNYSLIYNTYSQLTTINNYGTDHKIFRERTKSYISSSENISAMTVIDYPDYSNSFTYVYDKKNGVFKHIQYGEILFLEVEYAIFNHTLNNILSYLNPKKPQDNITFSYQYDTENYPLQITMNKNNTSQTFKITYAELKQ